MILLPRVMKKQIVLCFSFSSIDVRTLVTYKLQQHEFMGTAIPIKWRIFSFFKYAKKTPTLFVTTGKTNLVN